MPTYAYRCRECAVEFDLHRPMSEAAVPAQCPSGHADTVKLLSTVALAGHASGPGGESSTGAAPAGGCCGGACGCSG